jgi:hypothetical protein
MEGDETKKTPEQFFVLIQTDKKKHQDLFASLELFDNKDSYC